MSGKPILLAVGAVVVAAVSATVAMNWVGFPANGGVVGGAVGGAVGGVVGAMVAKKR